VLKIDAAALGLDGSYRALEMESGEEVDAPRYQITTSLRKHAYKQFRTGALRC